MNSNTQIINADLPIRLITCRGFLETFTLKDLTREETLPDEFTEPFDTWEEARDWIFSVVAFGDWKPIGTFFFKSVLDGMEEFQKRDEILNDIYGEIEHPDDDEPEHHPRTIGFCANYKQEESSN